MTATYSKVKTGFYLLEKNGTTQPPPYKKPLYYRAWGGTDVATDNWYPPDPSTWFQPYVTTWLAGSTSDQLSAQAKAKAYDKLLSKIKGEASAMLAVNVAERKQSINMVAERAKQLYAAYHSMRSLDLKGFLGAVGFRQRKAAKNNQWVRVGKGRTYTLSGPAVDRDANALRIGAKRSGALWLEYWFGWKPLISDIQASIDILTDVAPTVHQRHFVGRGSSSYDEKYYQWLPWAVTNRTILYRYNAQYSCTCRVTNQSVLNAGKFGMINAATVAWELVPYSFLVDWFLPVSKFLDSLTATAGLNITDVQLAHTRRITYDQTLSGGGRYTTLLSKVNHFERNILNVLPTPGLFDRRGTAIASATRAATAISLLVGFLKRSPLH